MGVYQEGSYFITEEFTHEQAIEVKRYLNHNQPCCIEAEWEGTELILYNFDTQPSAEYFSRSLWEHLESLN